MHPEPWPSAQHLPVIALAIVLCAALVAATLITARLRLGQVRETDTRKAQIGVLEVRIASLETSQALTSNGVTNLASHVTAARTGLDSASVTLNGSVSIPGNIVIASAAASARDCACSRLGCKGCQGGRDGAASA